MLVNCQFTFSPINYNIEPQTGKFQVSVTWHQQTLYQINPRPLTERTGSAKGNVRFSQLNLFKARSNAVRPRRTGRRNRVRWSLRLECGRQNGRTGAAHAARDAKGSDFVFPSLAPGFDGLDRFDNIGNAGPTLSNNAGDSGILLVFFRFETGMLNGPIHGNVRVLGVGAAKAQDRLGDERLEIFIFQGWSSKDLRLDAESFKLIGFGNARFGLVQTFGDIFQCVAQTRSNAHSRHHDAWSFSV